MGMPGGTPAHDHLHKQATLAFQEYQFVAEDTAKMTDRRQTVNTLFVSINALFLTGVGYLFYQYFQSLQEKGYHLESFLFPAGFLVIAIITTLLNQAWLTLSEQNRKLINLRIRYLEALEVFMRGTGFFANISTPLKNDEEPPATFPKTLDIRSNDAGDQQRYMDTRGTYTIEEVLFNNPDKTKKPFVFSKTEERIGHIFHWAYWLGFVFSLIIIAIQLVMYFSGFHATLGPYSF